MERLHRCMTKATTAEGDDVRHSLSWVLARRALLEVWPDRLVCGDWTIRYDEIRGAVLFSVRSSFLIPGYVLRIRHGKDIYQFGLNWGRFWKGDLPFHVRREKATLGYSPWSLSVRIVIVGLLLWQFAPGCAE